MHHVGGSIMLWDAISVLAGSGLWFRVDGKVDRTKCEEIQEGTMLESAKTGDWVRGSDSSDSKHAN